MLVWRRTERTLTVPDSTWTWVRDTAENRGGICGVNSQNTLQLG